MNPVAMLSILVAALAAFGWSAKGRLQLLGIGSEEGRLDRPLDRVDNVMRYAVKQEKMYKYPAAGLAHQLIFAGFVILLFRTLILWGRGFFPSFGLFFLAPGQYAGDIYGFIKDVLAVLVIGGASFFLYQRAVVKPSRMTLSGEGMLILGIILTMMLADIVYDGAAIALHQKYFGYQQLTPELKDSVDTIVAHRVLEARVGEVHWHWMEPAGTAAAKLFEDFSPNTLVIVAHSGFWVHSALVLIFLNLLPHSKHFHIITAIPNIFFASVAPRGRLPFIGGTEQLMEKVGAASEEEEPVAHPGVGAGRIEHLSWKSILDFYTCTECGRCSDNCPAHLTGKLLSPKHLTLDLRNYFYKHQNELNEGGPRAVIEANVRLETEPETEKVDEDIDSPLIAKVKAPVDLVVPSDPATGIIHPDVIWNCTTCRACEEQCPVLISYVDKIVEMRRNVVMVRGEFPQELQRTFTAMETNGNPWNLSRLDRAAWSEGLDVPLLVEHADAPVLYWVGCAASYDDRAKKIARATAKLLKAAKVDFAILGQEENCTGDPARRAGNEYLFATLAEGNVATLNGYEVAKKKIITTCPHCFNTLLNEYPDFGGKFEVVHHTTFLLELLKEKKLTPKRQVADALVYHDSCYLGRYNDVYDAPREILTRISGSLVEAEWSKSKGLCCGAGGAQMFMEEHGSERVNKKRTLQLLDTGAKTIASACPFCMTMLTDGLKSENLEEKIRQMDVAELLEQACALEESVHGHAHEAHAHVAAE